MLICHLSIFGEVSVQVFGLLFTWVVYFLNTELEEFFVYVYFE